MADFDEVAPGLWMGGAGTDLPVGRFSRVLTLCDEAEERGRVPEGTEAVVWRILDAEAPNPDELRAWASRVAGWVQAGDQVLVRCASGLNRSGLVAARVLIAQGSSPAEAILAVREARSPEALNNPWFTEWLLTEGEGAGPQERARVHSAGAAPPAVRARARLVRTTSIRWGLDVDEVATTAVTVVASSALYAVRGAPYLARGVIGDLAGFVVLGLVVATARRRLRHEAVVCLAAIGVTLAAGPTWPLELASGWWWAAFAAGLAAYVALRWRRLPTTGQSHRGRPSAAPAGQPLASSAEASGTDVGEAQQSEASRPTLGAPVTRRLGLTVGLFLVAATATLAIALVAGR